MCRAWHTRPPRTASFEGPAVGNAFAESGMEHDLTEKRPVRVQSRFELAIRRMVDAWLEAGRLEVSAGDLKLAREFLEETGCRVEDAGHARLRLVSREGRAEEMSREAAVMAAFRRLANRR